MSSVLERIVETTREDVKRRSKQTPASQLEALLGDRDDRPFSEALSRPGVSLIAEHKRRSPSAGAIREGGEITDIVRAYEAGGASALSILTEERHFGGSLDDLRAARAACGLPILRKDFIVDPYQVVESAAAGADAILLIVAALEPKWLKRLYDEEELECALEVVDADVIGINNRDLGDFTVDIQRTFELLSDVPAGKTVVAESGFHTREQIEELERVGIDAVLIGEALMRSEDLEAATRVLTGTDLDEPEL